MLFVQIWLAKGTLISHVSLTPLTIINQTWLWPLLKQLKPYNFTIISLIPTCVTKVYSLLADVLSVQHKEL